MNRLNRFAFPALLAMAAFFAGAASPARAQAPEELLVVWPVDTNVVNADAAGDVSVLFTGKNKRKAPSAAALIARTVYPTFGKAFETAARNVSVIDSSGAATAGAGDTIRVRSLDSAKTGDSVAFRVPVSLTPDSARYALVLAELTFSESSASLPRRFVPPTAPAFDPATGKMNPGNREGYAEGGGRVNTLRARAVWMIWDHSAKKPLARGTATGEATYRGGASRDVWDVAARELAKSVLKQTIFTPF